MVDSQQFKCRRRWFPMPAMTSFGRKCEKYFTCEDPIFSIEMATPAQVARECL
jgi:hypothetical protein